jgi:hypothetical protein
VQFRLTLPDDAKESVRRLALVLPYLSAIRRSTSQGAQCDIKVGDTFLPWDEATRSYEIPMWPAAPAASIRQTDSELKRKKPLAIET